MLWYLLDRANDSLWWCYNIIIFGKFDHTNGNDTRHSKRRNHECLEHRKPGADITDCRDGRRNSTGRGKRYGYAGSEK